ncbi:MAG: CDP-diacylglycerol--glycerol-3-phosphate 3-phosphatidyltransferase [Clostridia bacterium]|nr:CDP-diacylglycerol--glycerol-3-phosphate 3-phosphatidyltransferase [Clostridia bacterium]
MNIPNILTMIRLGMVPCFAVVYLSNIEQSYLIAGIIFVLASLTDIVDGYIARKYNQVTKLGRMLDPLADKLLQLTALACLAVDGIMPWILFCILITKELMMMLGGVRMAGKFEDVMPSNKFGKIVSFIVSFSIASTIIFGAFIKPAIPHIFAVVTVLAIAALVNYFVLYVKVMLKKRDLLTGQPTSADEKESF